MGLDMYLYREHYVKNWDHMGPDNRYDITVNRGDGSRYEGIDTAKIAYISEEIAYWRKANQIHRWFVQHVQNNVDDCGEYYVGQENLNALVTTCANVLDNHDLAQSLMPPQAGFFFGHTEVDEYYFQALSDTVRMLTPYVTENPLPSFSKYMYHSSW